MPREVLLLLREETSSKTDIRKKKKDRKRNEASWSKEQVEPEYAAARLVLAPREADQKLRSVSEVRTGVSSLWSPLNAIRDLACPARPSKPVPSLAPGAPCPLHSLCGDGS